ncbi:methyltransferase domain-containing protein [bacterium]|nr:methyltransferase domain-containing protein [bacterium]
MVFACCLSATAGEAKIVSPDTESGVTSEAVPSAQLKGSEEKTDSKQEAEETVDTGAQPPESGGEDLEPPEKAPDVVYVPTPHEVVKKMLEMAEIKKGDVVYDLGCGDGRIVVAAAKKYKVKAVGFDIDPKRIKESLANVKSNKVEHLVTIKKADIFTLDLREATVVTLYLLPQLNVRLMPQLKKLKPGSRIVSHAFDMRGAKPVQVYKVKVKDEDYEYYESEHIVYKWVVPWEKEEPKPEIEEYWSPVESELVPVTN